MSDSDFEQVHPLSAPPQLTAMEEQKELLQMMERTAKLVDVKLKIQILEFDAESLLGKNDCR